MSMKKYYIGAILANLVFWLLYIVGVMIDAQIPRDGLQYVSWLAIIFMPATIIFAVLYGVIFYKKTKKILPFTLIHFGFYLILLFLLAILRTKDLSAAFLTLFDSLYWPLIASGLSAAPGIIGKISDYFRDRIHF